MIASTFNAKIVLKTLATNKDYPTVADLIKLLEQGNYTLEAIMGLGIEPTLIFVETKPASSGESEGK